MRKIAFLLFSVAIGFQCFAQSEETEEIQQVFDAFVSFRNAAVGDDVEALRLSATEIKQCRIDEFRSLSCDDDSSYFINGHLVFDAIFADSLSNDDRSGTTVIGKYLLNHSFMMPGLICVITSTIVAYLLSMLFY